ncbi:MAG: nitroreductase [Chromatiales bacterium]|nr:nitroreductase [Gammaproteobacteria bacterium]MBW6476040.1 nitroreductase [Chromatiales bacterium]
MEFDTLIKGRFSCRAFLDTPVAHDTVRKILDTARWAPSSTNMQPWQVAVVEGGTLQHIGAAMIAAREQGGAENPDYSYYPEEWFEPYKGRRKATGLALYGALGIGKDDKDRRLQAWYNNYRLFGAPVGLMIFLDSRLGEASLIDIGIFIQSLVLAARDQGLDSCIEASLGEFPDIVREALGVDKTMTLACGIALGYGDPDAAVNNYRTPRENVETFTCWYD